jgi:hypothetical protein
MTAITSTIFPDAEAWIRENRPDMSVDMRRRITEGHIAGGFTIGMLLFGLTVLLVKLGIVVFIL